MSASVRLYPKIRKRFRTDILCGEVYFILYKGDHYHLTVRTDDGDDIFVDTNDVWDDGDRVGIRVAPSYIRLYKKTAPAALREE